MKTMILSRAAAWSIAVLVAVGMPTSACTFLVKADTAQCETDLDCAALGPSFEGTTCGPRKTCIPLDSYCSTNLECISRGGSEAYICKHGETPLQNKCVGLLSPECPKLLADPGDVANDDALIVGSVWMPSWSPILKGGEDGLELARQDFQRAQGGIPPLPGKKARPIVVVACDIPIGRQDTHSKATDHLIDDVGVPMMFGPLTSPWIAYALNRAVPKGIAVMSPDATPKNFSAGYADGLFFSNGVPPGTVLGGSLLPAEQEKLLRAAGKTGDIKVALMTTGLASDFEIGSGFYKNVTFNGKSAKDNGDNYLEADFGDLSSVSTPEQSVDFARAVGAIQTFKPDIIACFASGCDKAAAAVEKTLHPYWVFSSIMANNAVAELFDAQPGGVTRVLGTRPGRPANDERVAIFNNRFGGIFKDISEPGLASQTYDLFYFMAYAASSLGTAPITGKAIGDAILNRFVVGGKAASTRPDLIVSSVQALASGNNLEMDGTQTTGIFNPQGALKVLNLTAWCFTADKTKPRRLLDSGLYFQSDLPGVQGKLTCF
jgi:hypothetical protein